ncbi:glycosyltransferase [Dysgonomonas sp. 520]|uniref:glycosyltransferase n=1 Tax=Dysgonomonas sp. 520 TaxID=2302931 RepID=UPI0013D7F595|nr:glycosyltransferase [Dysgonomonas sp. 520]NDW09011.1 glycosyltransferase [Dysgonomonas sp. 520]
MRILNTISSLGVNSGGPTQSLYFTVKELHNIGLNVDILSYYPSEGDSIISDEKFIISLKTSKGILAYSPEYKKSLINSDYDIYHTHGIWEYPNYITSKIAKRKGKPYVVTLHGMLYPQAMRIKSHEKRILLKLFFQKIINNAAAVHATCLDEMNYARELGITSPIAVIPNPVEISENTTISNPDKVRIGYLGRIRARSLKNVDRLIYIWDKLRDSIADAELVIIGGGDDAYLDFLKSEVKRLGLNNVVFTGFLSGEAKNKAINSLSYLAVPSDFESFGMIVPEALTRGIPVIASKGTPWEELNTHNCGWWVDNDIDTFANAIKEAISLSDQKRLEMADNGRKLIRENYSMEVVSKMFLQLYNWINSGENKPNFVYL